MRVRGWEEVGWLVGPFVSFQPSLTHPLAESHRSVVALSPATPIPKKQRMGAPATNLVLHYCTYRKILIYTSSQLPCRGGDGSNTIFKWEDHAHEFGV